MSRNHKKKASSSFRIQHGQQPLHNPAADTIASRINYVDGEQQSSVPPLTEKEKAARVMKKLATGAGGMGMSRVAFGGSYATGDTIGGAGGNFYSPQLSTDFLEQPQNLRERRAWYRHFYYKNELVGAAIDLHSTIPLSKIRLQRPKAKNQKNAYAHSLSVRYGMGIWNSETPTASRLPQKWATYSNRHS